MLFFILRGLPLLLEIGLLVFCLIQVIQTPADEVRGLSKGLWVMLIIFLPLIGSIAWLVAGRPVNPERSQAPWPSGATAGFPEYERPGRQAPLGPDDDPAFLASMQQVNEEQERTLQRWEDDLRGREEQLRQRDGDQSRDDSGQSRDGGNGGAAGGDDREPRPDSPAS